MGREFAPIADRMKAYEAVRELVESEKITGAREIIKKLDARGYALPSRETIRRWARGKTSPLSGKRLFSPTASDELSFFLGAWLGDGWADESDGGKRLRLKVRSESFAAEFARAASSILSKSNPYKVWTTVDEGGPWYNVKVTSFMLYDFVNQSFDVLRKVIEPFPLGFLRGFFTAEGNPSVSIEATNGPYLQAGLVVANSDYKLLEFTRDMVLKSGFHPGRIRLNILAGTRTNLAVARSSGWLLNLSRFGDACKFANLVGFADKEKQLKLVEALSLIKKHGRIEAAIRWRVDYEKLGKKWVRRSALLTASW